MRPEVQQQQQQRLTLRLHYRFARLRRGYCRRQSSYGGEPSHSEKPLQSMGDFESHLPRVRTRSIRRGPTCRTTLLCLEKGRKRGVQVSRLLYVVLTTTVVVDVFRVMLTRGVSPQDLGAECPALMAVASPSVKLLDSLGALTPKPYLKRLRVMPRKRWKGSSRKREGR